MSHKTELRRCDEGRESPGGSYSTAARFWPWVVDAWIVVVFVLFMVIRVMGSNTGKHVLRWLGAR